MNNSIDKACTPAGTHLFHGVRVFLVLFLAGLSAALAPAQCPSLMCPAIVLGLIIGTTINFSIKNAKFYRASLLAFVGCISGAASGFAGTLTIAVPSGGPVLIGDPLLKVPSSLATLLPVFSGSLDLDNVYIYNCSGIVTCYAIDSGSASGFDDCNFNPLPTAPMINPGQGFIYVNNQGVTETFTFTGTPGAPLLPPANYCGCGSWSLLCGATNGSSYQQVTGFAPQQGAQVATNYTGGTIEPSYTFSGGVWTPSTPVLTPGQAAFFYVPCSTNCSPIFLSPDPLPESMPGVFYNHTLTASGGTGPYTYGITAGALPFDLTLSSSGVLSGEATTLGVYGFTVTVTNATGCTGSQTYYLTNVCATLTLSPSTLPGYTIGAPYSQSINASGSTPPYYYTVTSGTLPPGNPAFTLSLDTGVLSGTPTSPGTYCFTVTATTTNGCTANMTYCLTTNNCPAITLSPSSLNNDAQVGQAYGQTITASGSSAVPYTFTAPDGTPPGLTLYPNGTLAGTNTASGIFCFLVTATDTNGCTDSRSYCLTNVCPAITFSPGSLPGYMKNIPYNQTIIASPSGTPYTFTVTSGLLPPGSPSVTLSPSGVLSGTPTNNGVYCFTVTATEDGCSASMNYCLTNNTACPAITLSPSSLNSAAQVGQAHSQQFTASGSSATPYTFTTTPGTLPSGFTLSPSGLFSGTPTNNGVYCFLVTATDTNGCSGSRSYCLTNLCPTITFSPGSLPGYTKNVSYNQTITASPSGTPYTFTVTSGSLPPGNPPVTLSPTGVLSGTPTNNGVYCFTVTATADGCSASMNYCLTNNTACPTITLSPSSLNSAAQVGQAYSQQFTASGSSAVPYTFTTTPGTLPSGFTLSPSGLFSGTPTNNGVYCFLVTATDTNGCSGSGNYCLTNICPNIVFSPGSLPGYTKNVSYSQTITASPSGTPYTFTVTSGSLPPGTPPVTLSPTGVLSGTPTNNGVYCFTVTATADGCSASMNYCLTNNTACPAITLSPSSLNSAAQVGQLYSQQFTASGSSATPYTFTTTPGTLPSGFTLSPSGLFSGTPTNNGVYCFLVTATDTNGCSGSGNYCLTNICPNIVFSPGSLPGYTKNVSYSQTITASPSGTPYTFTVTSGSLPPGTPPVTLSPTGVLSGTPTNNGVYCFTVTATADGCSASMNYCLTNNTACPAITLSPSSLNSAAQVGQAYSQQFTASGSSATPYTFTTTPGTLPPGLTLGTSGLLSGTPTNNGVYCFLVTATDTNGCSGSGNYCLTNICPTITIRPASLPNGTVEASYSQTLTAGGGTGPYTFTPAAGTTLPSWLTLSTGGVLSGTPTTPGMWTFGVSVTTTNGCPGTTNYTLTVNCPPIYLAPGILPAGTVGGSYSQTLTASGGTGPYTFTVATSSTLPPWLNLSLGGVLSGTPTAAGSWTFTVTATTTNDCTGSTNLTLTVSSNTPCLYLACPNNVTTNLPCGANCVVVTYPPIFATNFCNPTNLLVTNSLPSGTCFELGTNLVTVMAYGSGQSTNCTFTVTVLPETNCPCVPGESWTQTSAPEENWRSVASSADGSKLVAVVERGGIYTSANSGATWTQTSAPFENWISVASSADGTKLVAVVWLDIDDLGLGGGIYTSVNGGATWTQTIAPDEKWWSVASSADGTHLVAVVNGGGIYTSVNGGATWTQTIAPDEGWWSVASSADGTKLIAGGYPGGIYTSVNGGATWTQTIAPTESWNAVASSADGTKLVAARWGGGIYTLDNGGTMWMTTSAPSALWKSVASSADGTKLVAVVGLDIDDLGLGGGIYTSVNGGVTWTQTSAPSDFWKSVASSVDGTKLVAGAFGGGIWTSECTSNSGSCLGLVTPTNLTAYLPCGADCAPVFYPPAVATNSCDPSDITVTYSLPSGYCFGLGTTPVVVTAAGSGQTTIGAFSVTMLPGTNCPSCLYLSCPNNVTTNLPCGSDCLVVTYPPAFATNICSATNLQVTYSLPSGYCFPVGTNTVEVMATGSGQSTNCSFTVTVLPGTNCPQCVYLSPPANVTTNLPCGDTCVAVSFSGFATNVCDPSDLTTLYSVTPSVPLGPVDGGAGIEGCFGVGTYQVTETATGSGQSTNCTFTVMVLPCTNCPTITISPALLPNGTLGSGYSLQLTASGGTAPYTFTVTPGTTLPTGFNLGANGLLSGTPISSTPSCFAVTATDANGCSGTKGYCLTNNSCISITCPTNPVVTTCVNTMQVFYSGSVTDSCTTDYKVVYNPPSGTVFPLGTTPVSVTVTDALGNIADCGFVVTVLPCTVNGVKYVQWPNTNNGDDVWDGNKWPTVADGWWFLADDFICTNTGYITDLHLWGSWQDDVNYSPNTTFWLGLFTDEPTNASNAFSHPGNLIWEQCFTPGDYSVSLWGTDPGNFLDPGSSNSVRGTDSQIWYYSFYPTNPPVQHGTPFAPKTYWLGVFAEVGFEGFSVEFGWHNTTNVQNDISVHAPWAFGYCPASLPQPGANWTPTYDNSGKPVDLAFAIGTDTNCSCSFLTITLDPIGNGTNKVIVTWPSGYLQVATNVNGPYSFVPGITTPYATSPYTNQALPPLGCTNLFWRVDCTNTPNPPGLPMTTCDGMALVPGGMFLMGDTVDGDTTAAPTNVTVSAFYMDTNLVSYGQWQAVYTWATSQGYDFDNVGSGKAANHPVQFVDWCDAVKWCNARSQRAGLTPVYYTDTNLTQVYTSGQVTNPGVLWGANGYRLPTEAEWEKAARGGQSGLRFPWGMTISWGQANYYGDPGSYAFDLAPANGYDPQFDTGGFPYTSPVGSFAPNGYGLYDMAGNLQEMCWDWLGTPYGQPTNVNPTGPATGTTRVLRGGAWYFVASTLTCAVRYETEPTVADTIWGFRCVRADIPFDCGH